ncbi:MULTISPECIES: hypothetical protein [Rhizobiaceae]|uniref:Uncharacterized protein n=1 Tax=Peteryoungia ipomoeae TaxID=1210932 RepID=A0A4S8NR71_9HYPH|nr:MULTISPECIES: hypothetical protein [Rhizobiaceae]THV19717.1 hypothetical protein FAA97_20655 [Peteryoungia ipomoeae]
MSNAITVLDNGHPISFTFDATNAHHGGGSPGGVTHALKAMRAAFRLLSDTPLERREVTIVTAFPDPEDATRWKW